MKIIRLKWLLGLVLAALTVALAAGHYLLFRDARNLAFYLALDLVFIPLQVLFVTLILDSFFAAREKRRLIEKMNMAVGVFFSEIGKDLLRRFRDSGAFPESLFSELRVLPGWNPRQFESAARHARSARPQPDARRTDLASLRSLLLQHRDFLLRLLQNPNLLEHESFTDLLQAVFHLAEELALRSSLDNLPEPDLNHLSNDMERAAGLLVLEWLAYLQHLQKNYPYLFSLATRTNPFNREARAEIAG